MFVPDADADYSEFPPPHWTVYDSANQRFFSSDYSLGHLNVFDEKTETAIASLNIPGAFGIDIAQDNSVLYVGTLSGDLYLVDPVNLVVTRRYLSSSIGASGFAANAVYALTGGALLLQRYFLVPGFSWVDGNGPPVIWNPSTNATTQLTGLSAGVCGKTFEFGLLHQSAVPGSAMTPTLTSQGSSNLCSVDLSSQSVVVSPTLQTGTGTNSSSDDPCRQPRRQHHSKLPSTDRRSGSSMRRTLAGQKQLCGRRFTKHVQLSQHGHRAG